MATLDRPSKWACGGHDYGSGVRLPGLANLRPHPAWTRPLVFLAAVIIPGIFRIAAASGGAAFTGQGMACVRSGQAPAWPLVL
jgi:hypothetical protein